jgi:hypothetical protein
MSNLEQLSTDFTRTEQEVKDLKSRLSKVEVQGTGLLSFSFEICRKVFQHPLDA